MVNKQLENLPNFAHLNDTLSSYLELDAKKIQGLLTTEFEGVTMTAVDVRFFRSFINQQANLFSQPFDRSTSMETTLQDVLTHAEQEAERYYHIFRKSAVIVDFKKKDVFEAVKALDPTLYFYDAENGDYFVADGSRTLLFKSKKDQEKVTVYTIEGKFQEKVISYNPDQTPETNGYDKREIIDTMPIVEWSYDRISTSQPNGLVPLERNFIVSITWGLWNANPKLVQHIVAKTTKSAVQVQEEMLPNFGKTNLVTKMGTADDLMVFDTGDITVLKDLLIVYRELIVQRALTLGVDKNSIVPTEKVESGEAKKVVLGYVNQARNNFIYGAKLFEKKVVDILEKMGYTIDEYNGIYFRPIEIVPEPQSNLDYAKAMMAAGFWSFKEALSYVLDISIDDAETRINELGLKPDLMYYTNEEE